MIIHKITIKNFQLFRETQINLSNLNIIRGENFDDSLTSSNGSGKTTIINAILFGIFGDVPGLNLKDLISLGEKECSVIVECSLNGEHYLIHRKIPANLQIYKGNEEIQFNTNTLKQQWITDHFCSLDYFRKFRIIDTQKGISLLDQGSISLKKILMQFVDSEYFNKKRLELKEAQTERELKNKDKRYYKFHLSEKRLKTLEEGIIEFSQAIKTANIELDAQNTILNKLRSDIKAKETLIYYNRNDMKKLQGGICPVLSQKCTTIYDKAKEVEQIKNREITQLNKEIATIQESLSVELDLYNSYQDNCTLINHKKQAIQDHLMKLKEAFKFQSYKYTQSDVELYKEAIKTLDNFAGYYINEWLSNLSIIINDLLKDMNLVVEFSSDKEFITIKNGTSELKFDMLSSGQKIFLNSVFKIAILLQKGESSGIIMCDEGMSSLDKINLEKFIDILRDLQFQCILIYQNINQDIKDIHYINVERKDGVSQIK